MPDQIIEPILQPTAKDINKNFQNNSKYLKKSAGKFLKGVRQIINGYNHIRVLLKKTKTGTGSNLQTIYNAMKDSTQVTKECIKLQYAFENALNIFLGRQIQLLYVTQDGKMLYADEITAAKIYQTAVAKSGGKGSIKNLNTSQLLQFPKGIAEDFKSILQERQNLYAPIRDEVINRWSQNHNPNNRWVKKDPNHQDTFYWLNGIKNNEKEWDWSKKMNRGHIYETHAHLVWEEKEIKNFNPQIETDIGRYWRYMEGHGLLNSIAGVVEGDVTFFLNPSIQFAVKSGSFNTAAIGAYIDVAYQLYYGTITIDKTMVYTLLDHLSSYSYEVRNHGLNIAEKKLNKFIQSMK